MTRIAREETGAARTSFGPEDMRLGELLEVSEFVASTYAPPRQTRSLLVRAPSQPSRAQCSRRERASVLGRRSSSSMLLSRAATPRDLVSPVYDRGISLESFTSIVPG